MRSRCIRRASVAVVCPMILLAGCADRLRPAVEQTATAFLAAVGLDATEWGGTAQVHTTTDTLFLTRTSQGWRIAAAGCQSRGDAPYACKVEGP